MINFNKLNISNNQLCINVGIEDNPWYEDVYLKSIKVYTPDGYTAGEYVYPNAISGQETLGEELIKNYADLQEDMLETVPSVINWYNEYNNSNSPWNTLKSNAPSYNIVYKTVDVEVLTSEENLHIIPFKFGDIEFLLDCIPNEEISVWELLANHAKSYLGNSTNNFNFESASLHLYYEQEKTIASRKDALLLYRVKLHELTTYNDVVYNSLQVLAKPDEDEWLDNGAVHYLTEECLIGEITHGGGGDWQYNPSKSFDSTVYSIALLHVTPGDGTTTDYLDNGNSQRTVYTFSSVKFPIQLIKQFAYSPDAPNEKIYTDELEEILATVLQLNSSSTMDNIGELIDIYKNAVTNANKFDEDLEVYSHLFPERTAIVYPKQYELILNSYDLVDPKTFNKINVQDNLLIVEVETIGYPSADCPCGSDKSKETRAVYNKKYIFDLAMQHFGNLNDGCNIDRTFINFILKAKALDLSIEACNYLQAIKYWQMFTGANKQSKTTSNCGCHG